MAARDVAARDGHTNCVVTTNPKGSRMNQEPDPKTISHNKPYPTSPDGKKTHTHQPNTATPPPKGKKHKK